MIKNNEYLIFKMKKTLLFFTAIINFIGFSFFVNAADVTINGSNSTNYTFDAGNTLTLKGPANASGKLNFNSGTISITSVTDNLDQITGEVNTTSGTDIVIDVSNGNTLTISAIIGGEGSVNKDGEGNLILNQSNVYTGTTTISDGTLQLDASGTLSDSTPVNVSNKGIFDVNVTNTIASIEGSGIIDIASSTTLTAGDANDKEFSGVIQGAGNFSKLGSSTLTLSGTNTYTGSTTINAGTISVESSANLGATPGLADADNIIFNGGTLNTTADFTLGANKGITMTGAGTIDIDAGTTLTYAGSITDSGTLTKAGTGTLSLSGSSDNSGGILVSAGKIEIGNNASLGTGTITLNGGTLSSDSTTARTLDEAIAISSSSILGDATNTGKITLSGNSTFSGTNTLTANSDIELSGSVDLGSATQTFSVDSGKIATLSGAISSGAISKSGDGTLIISADNDYASGTTVSAGTLRVSGSGDLGTGSLTIGASGTLDLRNTLAVASLEISGAGSGNRITNGDADGTTANLTVSGTSTLNGAVNTDGTQTYSGTTTLGSDVSLTGSTVSLAAISGGTNALAISGNLDLSGAASSLTTLSVSGTSDIGADVTTTGSQTYTGATTFSASSTLTGSTVNFGSTVDGGNNNIIISGNADIDGAITNTAALSVQGVGSTSNIGADITTAGVQFLGNATLSGAGNRTVTSTGGSDITFYGITGASKGLTVDGGFQLSTNDATGLASLSVTGASTLAADVTSTGTQSYDGTTTLSSGDRTLTASTVTLNAVTGGSNALTVTGNLVLDGAVSGVTNMSVSGTSNIGADVTTTGTQSYTGTTTVSASSTLIGTEISAAAIALDDDLEIRNSSDSTLASVISGTGALTKSGSGALTLRGVNTFDGDLTVSAGTLYAGLAADSGNQVIENNVTVSGGTLSGGATIGGNVTVATANLAPGNSIGTLTIDGNVTLGDNSTTTIEFNDTTSDKVVVSGNITLAGALVLEPANTTYSDATFTIFDGSGGSGNSLSGTFASTTVSNSSYLGDATTSISYDTVNRKVFLNIDEDGGVSSNTVKSLTTRNKFKDIAQIFDDATAGKILEVANVLKSSDPNSVNTELNKTKGTLLANSSLKSVSNHQFYQKALDNIVSTNTTSSVSNFTQNNLADLTLDNLQSEGLYGEKASYNDYYDFSDQSVLGFIKNNKNRTLLSKFSSEDRSSFLRTYGTSSENENIGADYTGYKSDTYGVLFGQQFKDSDKDFYGYAYGFSGTDIDYNNDYGETNAYTLHTSVFKQVSDDDYNLNLKLGGYLTNRQNERKVSVFGTSVDDIYKSETTDLGLQAGATYSRKYNILGLNLSPSISLSSTYEFKDDIDEEGGSLALKVDNENLLTIKPEIGFSLDKNFSTIENITNQFSFAMFASEDHYLEGTTASAKFATGSNFNLDLPRDKDQFLAAGLGYNFLNSESGTSLMANLFYTQNTENDYEGNLFSLTFRKLFGDFGRGRIPAVITEKVDEQKEKVVKIILPKVEKEEETIVDTVRRSLALLFQKEATSYRAYKDIYENFDCKVLEDVRLYQSLMYLSRPQVVNLLEKCDIEDQNTIALVANRLNDIQLNELTMFEILKKNYYYSLIYLPFITFIAFVILMYELSKKGYLKLRRKP
ncbi:autotransporter-associated beta strand repeat-containing protein [Candidatus Pelagibacter bacterium]|nr:autotransporter-associated beta strand repeat-containing protein [Candidatus Pelagibacter bacterium]MDB2693488.1 autotransporter-associated beta strand repeat-containing protein [Candidatus Pelagibacter bacterium]